MAADLVGAFSVDFASAAPFVGAFASAFAGAVRVEREPAFNVAIVFPFGGSRART